MSSLNESNSPLSHLSCCFHFFLTNLSCYRSHLVTNEIHPVLWNALYVPHKKFVTSLYAIACHCQKIVWFFWLSKSHNVLEESREEENKYCVVSLLHLIKYVFLYSIEIIAVKFMEILVRRASWRHT